MQIVEKVDFLRSILDSARRAGHSVGFVPTMGALHAGHLQLVSRSVAENDLTVVSIFVNPTQFNDKSDLEHYPRTLEADCALLREVGCDVVFAPSVEEVYPELDLRVFDFSPLDSVMEGGSRPGHFNGVGQVVSKLFLFVTPDVAYFGEKDFQQLAIIRKMTADLALPIRIEGCPIVREADGLAMSSRNRRLTSTERALAPRIYQTLRASVAAKESGLTVAEVTSLVGDAIGGCPGFRLDYFQIVDGHTLQPILQWEATDYSVGCIALFLGQVRLIDNITYPIL